MAVSPQGNPRFDQAAKFEEADAKAIHAGVTALTKPLPVMAPRIRWAVDR